MSTLHILIARFNYCVPNKSFFREANLVIFLYSIITLELKQSDIFVYETHPLVGLSFADISQMGRGSRTDSNIKIKKKKTYLLDKHRLSETHFSAASVEKDSPDVIAAKLPQLHTLRPDTHLPVRRGRN